jgi:DNA-binding MarR family transcriptional regulator
MSLLDDLGTLYLASRLVRLSETLKKDAALIFREQLKGIKYKWYPVLYAVHTKSVIGVVELANELSYAHPTIIEVLMEMQQEKLIRSVIDKKDKRKRVLSLTGKGKRAMSKMLPVTVAFEKAATDLMRSKHHLLRSIEAVETKLKEEDFFTRVNKIINQSK